MSATFLRILILTSYDPLGTTGGPLTCCDIKLVSWVEGDYRINDWPNPRGEIHIGGSNVAVGHFKQPEKTMKAFYEENGRRWFRTGDIGEFTQEGFLKVIFEYFYNKNFSKKLNYI